MNNKIRTLYIADTTGGEKLSLPDEVRAIIVIPEDETKALSIKFTDDDDFLVLPVGVGYDSGISNAKIDSRNITVSVSDGSGVFVEYWT